MKTSKPSLKNIASKEITRAERRKAYQALYFQEKKTGGTLKKIPEEAIVLTVLEHRLKALLGPWKRCGKCKVRLFTGRNTSETKNGVWCKTCHLLHRRPEAATENKVIKKRLYCRDWCVQNKKWSITYYRKNRKKILAQRKQRKLEK